MPFVKLDCEIIDSSLWIDRDVRSMFLTALVKARPYTLDEEVPQLSVRALEETGWMVPPGKYGFIRISGIGLARADGCDVEAGLRALEVLGNRDPDSRSSDFDGRRLVRIDGGYIVLNFQKFRDADYTAAERMRRMRSRKKEEEGDKS